MSPYWQNNSCSPFLGSNGTCNLGNLASYAINVSDAASVAAGVRFAQKKNIKLTIKNTGHDFLGRSAGEGSLALWTRNLKDMSFFNYSSTHYTGPAARIGAGIQAHEVYEAAHQHGLRVVAGSCPSVGVAGGFTQGAGHGPLGSTYGLGADQTLQFEVITASGQHLTASPTQNADLYWALSGGGAGNYAVVLSLTIKAHQDGPVAGASLTFTSNDADRFWAGVTAWLKHLLVLDKIPGFNTLWAFNNQGFTLQYATLPGGSLANMTTALAPFVQELGAFNLSLAAYDTKVNPTFREHYKYWATQTYDTNNSIGGRLIPRSAVHNNLPALVTVFRDIVNSNNVPGAIISGIANNVTHTRVGNTAVSNAVLPAWRDSLFSAVLGIPLALDASRNVMRSGQAQLNEWQDELRALTPRGGTYINEATYDNANWKSDYYGANYGALQAIKAKYDPNGLLWSNAAVGSDAWSVAPDGRLCRLK